MASKSIKVPSLSKIMACALKCFKLSIEPVFVLGLCLQRKRRVSNSSLSLILFEASILLAFPVFCTLLHERLLRNGPLERVGGRAGNSSDGQSIIASS